MPLRVLEYQIGAKITTISLICFIVFCIFLYNKIETIAEEIYANQYTTPAFE